MFDIEGTGINFETEHITQIGAVLLQNGEIKEKFSSFVKSPNVLLAELEQAGQWIDSKEFYFVNAKDLKLAAGAIRITEVEGSRGMRYTLETDVLANQVWLSAEREGMFSDNFFDLIPDVAKTVEFRLRESGEAMSKPAVPGEVAVRSMIDLLKYKKL